LIWSFIQNKDYTNAFRQVKALDRQLDEGGGRIYRLAEIAKNAKDYDAAIEAYDYIVAEKGKTSTYYVDAKREALSARRSKLVAGFDFERADLEALELQYNEFLDEFGRNKTSATIITELADLEAFYLNDLDKAIALLDELINYPGVKRPVQARAKLSSTFLFLLWTIPDWIPPRRHWNIMPMPICWFFKIDLKMHLINWILSIGIFLSTRWRMIFFT